jgi:hypothetical protein
MSAAVQPSPFDATAGAPRATTLLELVQILNEISDDEREVVATVLWMLESGRVRLCGNFRGATIDDFRC